MILQELINAYNLKFNVHNEYIYTRLTKVMYWITQAGRIANDSIVQHLASYVYNP